MLLKVQLDLFVFPFLSVLIINFSILVAQFYNSVHLRSIKHSLVTVVKRNLPLVIFKPLYKIQMLSLVIPPILDIFLSPLNH